MALSPGSGQQSGVHMKGRLRRAVQPLIHSPAWSSTENPQLPPSVSLHLGTSDEEEEERSIDLNIQGVSGRGSKSVASSTVTTSHHGY